MSVRFDANGKCLSRTTNVPAATAFTIMGWCKRAVDRNAVSSFGFLRTAAAGGSSVSGVQTGADGDSLGVWVNSLSTTVHTMVNDQWFFVGWKCDGTTVTVFARAAGAGSLTEATIADNNNTAAAMFFGDRFISGGEWINAYLADIKVYDAVLTTQECYDESLQLAPLRTANLNSWFLLDDVQTNQDQSGNGRHLTENGALTYNSDLPSIPMGGDPIFEQSDYRWFTNTGTGLGEPA